MKPIVKILAAFCLFLIGYHIYSVLYNPYYYDRNILVYFGVIVFWMVMIWWVARRNYRTNKRIQENLFYNLSQDKLSISGESFHVEFTWDKVYRVIKTKKWILIFQSRQSANLLDVNACDDATLQELKQICNSFGIKNNL